MTAILRQLLEALRIGTGFPMEQLFAALDVIPSVVEGESATAKDYFRLDYTSWLNLVAIRAGLAAGTRER